MELLSDPAIIWFLIGLGLLLLELALPGLVVLFFGIGAWITSLGHAIFNYNLNVQIVIFLASSLLGLVLLRKVLKRRFFDKKDEEIKELLEEFIGRSATVSTDFKNGVGQVEFKGTRWKATSENELKEGDLVVITKKESLTLYVSPK